MSDGASNAKASWIVGFDKSDPFAYARAVALKDSMLFAWNRTPFEMELGLALETKPEKCPPATKCRKIYTHPVLCKHWIRQLEKVCTLTLGRGPARSSLWSERYAHYVERTHREENARALQLIREPDNFVCVRYSFLSVRAHSCLCVLVCHRFLATHPKLTFTSEWEIMCLWWDALIWSYLGEMAKKQTEREKGLFASLSVTALADWLLRRRASVYFN